jgi:glutaconyl-CoA/methylmalonyl-CoA decarboxylase subunit gamma
MKSYRISVNGRSYDVTVEELGAQGYAPAPLAAAAPQAAEGAKAPPPEASLPPVAAPSGKAGSSLVKAPMPGTLLSYKVVPGQAVKRGDVLLILEAMKMENEIVAPADGVVAALLAAEGGSVNTGDALVELG